MKTMKLGKTGLIVSRVGIGGIPITRPSEDEAIKVIRRALDLGINFIDTAWGYKDSEERIGKAMAGRRDEVIISTKMPFPDKKRCLECLETSLKRLNTDYIDLWLFHGISNLENYEVRLKPGGSLEAAHEALKNGKVRHIGLSSHNVDVALKAVSSRDFETEAIMFPLNFVSDEAVDKLVPLTRELDVGFLAMKPFAGGRLRKNVNLAMKYLLQFDNVVPVPGIEKIEEIEEIVDTVNGSWKLTSEEQRKIREIRAQVGRRFCHQCEYCMPCPQGVFISGAMYLPILYELWPREWFLSWRYVQNSVKSVAKCIQCGECEKKCPYHLPIREMIAENVKFYENVAKGEA